jgi:hypothetical protein
MNIGAYVPYSGRRFTVCLAAVGIKPKMVGVAGHEASVVTIPRDDHKTEVRTLHGQGS